MFDWITELVSGNPWSYVVVAGVAAGDVLLPLLPSETVVLTAGVLAAQGSLMVWLIVVAAAAASWAVYVSMLGYLGGEQFRHSLWLPLLIGGGVALLVAIGVEVARRVARRRGHDLLGGSM